MEYPLLQIHVERIEENARAICDKCGKAGVRVVGVTKGACGHPAVARAMIAGGVTGLADSRLANIRRMKESGISAPMMLLRIPAPSELEWVPELADSSLNSEVEVIRALGRRAVATGRTHGVTLMVDVGERREGVMPGRVREVCREVVNIKGIRLEALGTAVGCFNAVMPTRSNVCMLVDLARDVGRELGLELGVSGGNTATTVLMDAGDFPRGVTDLRVGEAIILGTDVTNQRKVPGTRQDTMRFFAEVVEIQRKPSRPEGKTGVDAFGLRPSFRDRGLRLRAVVAAGKQDVEVGGLTPVDPGIEIEGASSDHMILDVEDARTRLRLGDLVEFAVDYPAMLRLMTSGYVHKDAIP